MGIYNQRASLETRRPLGSFFFAKVQTSNAYSDGTCGTGDGGEALTRKLFACVHSEPPPG